MGFVCSGHISDFELLKALMFLQRTPAPFTLQPQNIPRQFNQRQHATVRTVSLDNF